MKEYTVKIYLEHAESLINPRFEIVVQADSEAEARNKALKIYPTLDDKDIKYDGIYLRYKEISYIDIDN